MANYRDKIRKLLALAESPVEAEAKAALLRGHFPGEPVMPGVLQIEACAQVGAVAILSLEKNKGKTAYFGAVNNARFKRKVVPGDKLKMECEIIKSKGPVGIGKVTASVDGETALTAELTFMIG